MQEKAMAPTTSFDLRNSGDDLLKKASNVYLTANTQTAILLLYLLPPLPSFVRFLPSFVDAFHDEALTLFLILSWNMFCCWNRCIRDAYHKVYQPVCHT